MVSRARSANKGTAVGFQGLAGAYSERAARQFFGRSVQTEAFPEFADVFRALKRGRIAYAVLPFENSLTGSIHQNYDLLLDAPVTIVGEVKERIAHSLMAPAGTSLNAVRRVFSHPQALSQCAKFLAKQRDVVPISFFDTAGSAQYVATLGARDAAAIASPEAAERYGLRVLARGIEDNAANFTRFLVLAPQGPKRAPRGRGATKVSARGAAKAATKTSIVFALKSIPGALHKGLSVFALRDVDLVKIESRPIPGSPWSYLFYLDFVTPKDPKVSERALDHLSEVTQFTRVLGTYVPG